MNNSKILAFVVIVGLLVGAAPYLIRRAPEWLTSRPETSPASDVQPTAPTPPEAPPSRARGARPGGTPAGSSTPTTGAAAADAAAGAGPGGETAAGRSAAARRGTAGARGLAAPPASRQPTNLFLAANAATWTRLAVPIDGPTRLRTGGEMAVGATVLGATGFHAIVRPDDLVLPAAPYMSVIGRVCSADECSAPFAVGGGTLVCPAAVGMQGTLELWTNNFRVTRVAQSRSVYSQASGGFYVYASRAEPEACAGGSPANAAAATLAEGTTLSRPEFVISARQGAWKPLFVPLGGAVRIRATGEMRPSGDLVPTGPDGIAVADPAAWTYPGTSTIVIDAAHPLYVPGVPYQALIARLCGASRCDAPFVVGRDRTVCAGADFQDRLEVWINNILVPKGIMEQTMPLSLQLLNVQARTGEYRFTLTGVPRSNCAAGTPAGR